MEKLTEQGKRFDPALFMPEERLSALRGLFAQTGGHLLVPVVELSKDHPLLAPEGAGYNEARLARILLYEALGGEGEAKDEGK
jgi:hypothetical protein